MSRKIELVFAAFFALFFIGWLTFDIPVALGFVYKGTAWYAREIDPIFRDPRQVRRTRRHSHDRHHHTYNIAQRAVDRGSILITSPTIWAKGIGGCDRVPGGRGGTKLASTVTW